MLNVLLTNATAQELGLNKTVLNWQNYEYSSFKIKRIGKEDNESHQSSLLAFVLDSFKYKPISVL